MKIAAQAKKEQKLYDMLVSAFLSLHLSQILTPLYFVSLYKLPEKSIGFTSPIFWVLVGVVGYLHYYNGEQAKIKEEDAIRERKLAQMAIERRKVAPLTNEERLAQIGLKERQVVIWENKLAQAQREVDARGTGAEVRLAHAVDRLGSIKTSLAELRAGGENT